MYSRKVFYLIVFLFLLVACSTNNNDDLGSDLAVQIINTGTENLKIEFNSAGDISFCYEGQGCAASTFTQILTINSDSKKIIAASNPNYSVIGVKVAFNVLAGSGRAKILKGESYESEGISFTYNSDDAVVYTSEPFSAEDSVRFEYGDLN